MSEDVPGNSITLVATPLPASAVQALYHAATGKTENLTKRLTKNFIVTKDDLNQLYLKINQQLEHFEKIAGPTVTVNVKFANSEIQQFSSWERFSFFDSGTSEIISEIIVKFEFVIKLPDINDPQRYVLTVDIDSKLPVAARNEGSLDDIPLHIIHYISETSPSLTISVDFIDYLCAKNLSQIVEEWFKILEESRTTKWLSRARRSFMWWPQIFNRIALVGSAIFLSSYCYFRDGYLGNSGQIVYLISFAIILWAIMSIFCDRVGDLFSEVIFKSFIPPIILITRGDERAFKRIKDRADRAVPKLILYSVSVFGALAVHLVASFIYSWLTAGKGSV